VLVEEAADIASRVGAVGEEVIRWRRHLHRHPELSFQEKETARFVFETLREFDGLEVSRPTATGVLARLKGAFPGPVLALRADMDALPIQEESSLEFTSRVPGVMHACGHDGHTAILLGTARVLAGLRDRLHGEVRFVFQHAEEVYPGGARELVAAGVMEGVDRVVGLHLWSPLPVGRIEVTPGPVLAAPDEFRITVRGRGGHAAQPQETVDPILAAAQVVVNLQQIVSRLVDPRQPVVVSVTRFHAGTAHNIIPETAELNGTVRTFKPEIQGRVSSLMERIVRGVTQAHGATYDFRYQPGYRPVVNDPGVTAEVREILVEAFGEAAVVAGVPDMGGEDFSAYQEAAPGTFFMVGAGDGTGKAYPHHHPRFTINEESLPVGVKAFVHIALRMLAG